MPSAEGIVACGLDVSRDPDGVAHEAVIRYREAVFMRTFAVESPVDRTLLTALYFVQDALSGMSADGKINKGDSAIRVPGESGFPGMDHQIADFPTNEKELAREYLRKLRDAVGEQLLKAANENGEVRKWWLSLQKRRFMNRVV